MIADGCLLGNNAIVDNLDNFVLSASTYVLLALMAIDCTASAREIFEFKKPLAGLNPLSPTKNLSTYICDTHSFTRGPTTTSASGW